MKRILLIAIIALALLVLGTLYVVLLPLRAGFVGPVSVALQGWQTNSFGQREALVAITNQGPHELQLATGIEVRGPSGWDDSSGLANRTTITLDSGPALQPGAGRVVAVAALRPGPTWRVFAFCHIAYPAGWPGRIEFIIDGAILKRRPFERFFTPEISE